MKRTGHIRRNRVAADGVMRARPKALSARRHARAAAKALRHLPGARVLALALAAWMAIRP